MSSEPTLETTCLHRYLDGLRAGDTESAEALFQAVLGRAERLARRMLGGFPAVRGWADTDDVLQGALARLLRSLRELRPAGTRDFANLLATHIRRELLDLARRLRRHPDRPAGGVAEPGDGLLAQAPAPEADPPDELELWAAFHEQVEQLPAEEREVVGLTFYHGWTQGQIAELFGVDERTVRRRWRSACLRLGEALGGQLPEV
jgi:RNA polymerase sigma factor (sigma-70 family)